MTTERITLPDHQIEFIRKLIGAGRFDNPSEAVRAALQLFEDRLAFEKEQEEHLGTLLDEGLASGRSGDSFRAIWSEAEAEYPTPAA